MSLNFHRKFKTSCKTPESRRSSKTNNASQISILSVLRNHERNKKSVRSKSAENFDKNIFSLIREFQQVQIFAKLW